MTPDIRPLVAGNWKMNGLRSDLDQIKAIADGIDAELAEKIDILLCPPMTLLYVATALAEDTNLLVGAQDCHTAQSGAFTGDVSAQMIADCLGEFAIVGHSERRTIHGEDDATVKAKAQAAISAGLTAIVCIGETEEERKSGKTLDVLGRQLKGSVPGGATWAIGTGLTPTVGDIEEAHAFMRKTLSDRYGEEGKKMRLLYGGSVKPGNAAELMGIANVDGALVGGASLKAADFLAICEAYRTQH